MSKLILILALMFALFSPADANPVPQSVPPQLQLLAWSVGNWHCIGHYSTVPPFTVAHDDVAIFHVGIDVGDAWLSGQYTEISTTGGAPRTSIHELFTIDATGAGIREFADSNTGRFFGGFIAGPSSTEFSGSYTIFGQSVGFTETLTRGAGDSTFSTDSRVLLPIGPGGALVPLTYAKPEEITLAGEVAP